MYQIKEFCEKYGFCKDATDYLTNAFITLKNNQSAFECFIDKIKLYEENYDRDFSAVFDEIESLSNDIGIHKYTIDLLYLICLTPRLKELYKTNNIDMSFYDSSVCDLKWKAIECKKVYGVWGTFVGWWTIGFFKLKRFGMGRLQFNLRNFSKDISSRGLSFKAGDTYIDVHIPSSGTLDYKDCQDSYKMATDFFADYFNGKPVVFGCHSWLLSPDNKEILPYNSNVLKFAKDYTILEEENDPTNNNLWRIFDTFDLPENIQDLPQESSMQKAFVKWLEAGNTINVAFGVIIQNNN